jgi:hypothetical protein
MIESIPRPSVKIGTKPDRERLLQFAHDAQPDPEHGYRIDAREFGHADAGRTIGELRKALRKLGKDAAFTEDPPAGKLEFAVTDHLL